MLSSNRPPPTIAIAHTKIKESALAHYGSGCTCSISLQAPGIMCDNYTGRHVLPTETSLDCWIHRIRSLLHQYWNIIDTGRGNLPRYRVIRF